MRKLRGVGFWWSPEEFKLPKPYPRKSSWKGRITFLNNLVLLQKIAQNKRYKGWSDCRCCKKPNGSGEYVYKKWVWPEGLYHYVYEHNIKPDKEFVDYVISKRW